VTPVVQSLVSRAVAWSTASKADNPSENAETLEGQDSPVHGGPSAVTHIRVLPAHTNLLDSPAKMIVEGGAESAVEVNPELAPAVPVPQIPESLRSEVLSRGPSGSVSSALLEALEPVNITENLSENLLLEKVQPAYPEQAVRSGLQGSVVLQALIGRDGRIQNLKLVQGSFLLGQSAFQAVKQWRYRPYFRNGRAVQAQTLVTVDFSLPTRSSATLPSTR
jgi:TonB family protein